MKRIVFGAIVALTLSACGGTEEVTDDAPAVDSTAIIELENATHAVETGLENLENEVNTLNSDIDSLLNGI